MTPAKPIDRAKIAGLLKIAFERIDEAVRILHEVDHLNGGGAGIGAKMEAIAEGFGKAWESRYEGEKYAWNQNSKDRPAMKRLLHELSVDEIVRRAWVYITKPGYQDFYVSRRHPFLVFVGSINEHVGDRTVEKRGEGEVAKTRRMLDDAKRAR